MILPKIFQLLHKPNFEPEHIEEVDHDIVLEFSADGTVIDWTEDENDS